jgi:PPM family protein phosphatase
MLAASGIPDLPPRHLHPQGNVILRALGTATAEPELRVEALAPGDVYLLCTDGLSEMVEEARIAELMGWPSLAVACRALVEEAYRNGGRDNITAVLVRVSAA